MESDCEQCEQTFMREKDAQPELFTHDGFWRRELREKPAKVQRDKNKAADDERNFALIFHQEFLHPRWLLARLILFLRHSMYFTPLSESFGLRFWNIVLCELALR